MKKRYLSLAILTSMMLTGCGAEAAPETQVAMAQELSGRNDSIIFAELEYVDKALEGKTDQYKKKFDEYYGEYYKQVEGNKAYRWLANSCIVY